MKSWLEKNDIEMHTTHNEIKSIVAERFIKTLKRLWHGYIFRKYSNNINICEILLLCIATEILQNDFFFMNN